VGFFDVAGFKLSPAFVGGLFSFAHLPQRHERL
jgi:hypothetical protein